MATLIPFGGLQAAPWKNGGGSTTQIAAWPPGAGLDDFIWRISVATISADGPFSRFAGVERSLLLLAGESVQLVIDGTRTVRLDATAPLLCFDGEAAVTAQVSGATTDLNVMTRRASCRHQLTRITAPQQLVRASAATLLFAAGGALTVSDGCRQFALQRHDSLLLDAGEADTWQLDAAVPTPLVLVDLFEKEC